MKRGKPSVAEDVAPSHMHDFHMHPSDNELSMEVSAHPYFRGGKHLSETPHPTSHVSPAFRIGKSISSNGSFQAEHPCSSYIWAATFFPHITQSDVVLFGG